MKLKNKQKLKPDNILTCEFCSETNNIADGIQWDNTTMPNSQQESDLPNDVVPALMDWDPAQYTQDDKSIGYKCSHTKEEEYNTNDS